MKKKCKLFKEDEGFSQSLKWQYVYKKLHNLHKGTWLKKYDLGFFHFSAKLNVCFNIEAYPHVHHVHNTITFLPYCFKIKNYYLPQSHVLFKWTECPTVLSQFIFHWMNIKFICRMPKSRDGSWFREVGRYFFREI